MQVKVETGDFIPVTVTLTFSSSIELQLFRELCGANWSVAKASLKDSKFAGNATEETRLASMLTTINEEL